MKADIMESLTPGTELLSATAIEKKTAIWKLLELKKVYGGKKIERMFPEQGVKELPANH